MPYTKRLLFDLVSDWFDWQSSGTFDRQCQVDGLMIAICGRDYTIGSTEGLRTEITVIRALKQTWIDVIPVIQWGVYSNFSEISNLE
jgi:hypothetical protein